MQDSGFRVPGPGFNFKVQGLGFRVQASGCRVPSSGLMVGGITPVLEVLLQVFDVVGVGANSKVHADLSGRGVADCQQKAFADEHKSLLTADFQRKWSLSVCTGGRWQSCHTKQVA